MSSPKLPKGWWGDGPHPSREEMERRADEASVKCLEYVKLHAESGNPASVVATIDEFAASTHMMNIGPLKGAIIDVEIRKKKPAIMAELRGYTGYSAVRFASVQREAAGNTESHYFSFQLSPVFAERVREMAEIAGLSEQVTVYVGLSRSNMKFFSFYLIDHDKSAYLSDFKLILHSKTLAPGSIVAADNVGLGPKNFKNEYVEFIENNPQFSEELHTVFMKREKAMVPRLRPS